MSLNSIDELKEVDNIIYVIGLDRCKKFSVNYPVDQEAFNEFIPKNPNQE